MNCNCCLKAEFHAPKLSTSVGNIIIQGGVDVQPLSVTENGTYSESGKAYSPVIVDVEGIVPTGTLNITENGTYDVTEKAEAAVNVQPPLETATVTPTKQTQEIEPISAYGLSLVTVDPIPSEYIVPSGTQSVTQNGQYDITDKAAVDVQVRQPSGTKQISITANGTTTEDVEWYEDAELTVNVPNTYSAADEGKVVNNGALVEQTSKNITANGTVDTTLNDEVVVSVTNTYTQADEGKVVDNGALVAQTSRTVSDNGTYDTTLNNEVVVNNEDYSEALVAFGVEDDLADGIEAMTTYANEVTGESDTTLSDAVRTLADGYGGGEPDYDDVTLPAEYQRVEYIGSTGSQCIDLPFGFDPTDEICSVLLIPTGTTSENWLAAPQRWNTNNNRFCFAGVQGAYYGIGYGRAGTNGTVLQYYYANDGAFHKHTYKDYLFAIKEVNAYLGGVNRIDFGGTTANLRLFYGYNSGTAGKIRYYVHKKANNISVALYACYRKSDGVIGMYDVDNDVFYTNAGGGTFLKGEDI